MHVAAERLHVVTALLQHHRRQTQLCEQSSTASKPFGGHRQVGDRIGDERIETQRHDQRRGLERCDLLRAGGQCGDIGIISRALGQRHVEGGTQALPRSGFIRMTGEVRVRTSRIAVQRHVLHVVTVVENFLCAIAVVVVHVQHGDLSPGALHDVVCSNGRVVEEAVAAVQVAGGVMPRWATQPVHRTLAGEHCIAGGECGIHRSACRLVRALCQRRGGFETPPSQTSGDGFGFGGGTHLIANLVAVEEVGHHFTPIADDGLIFRPRHREKIDQAFVMNRLDRSGAMFGGLTKGKT